MYMLATAVSYPYYWSLIEACFSLFHVGFTWITQPSIETHAKKGKENRQLASTEHPRFYSGSSPSLDYKTGKSDAAANDWRWWLTNHRPHHPTESNHLGQRNVIIKRWLNIQVGHNYFWISGLREDTGFVHWSIRRASAPKKEMTFIRFERTIIS